jgi:hypothetical protein
MGKSGSIVNMVFSTIDNVVSTVETIHSDVAEKACSKNGDDIHRGEKRKNLYGLIKSINGKVGNLVSDFFKPGAGT